MYGIGELPSVKLLRNRTQGAGGRNASRLGNIAQHSNSLSPKTGLPENMSVRMHVAGYFRPKEYRRPFSRKKRVFSPDRLQPVLRADPARPSTSRSASPRRNPPWRRPRQ